MFGVSVVWCARDMCGVYVYDVWWHMCLRYVCDVCMCRVYDRCVYSCVCDKWCDVHVCMLCGVWGV